MDLLGRRIEFITWTYTGLFNIFFWDSWFVWFYCSFWSWYRLFSFIFFFFFFRFFLIFFGWFRWLRLILWLFRWILPIFFVIVNCEHLIVFYTIFQKSDGQFRIIGLRFFIFKKVVDVVGEAGPEGLVEFLVCLIFGEIEDIIDVT